MAVASPSEVHSAYLPEHEKYEKYADDIKRRISLAMAAAKLKPIMVTSRAKQPLDLYKKQRGKNYDEFWQQCPDVLGARIVLSVSTEKPLVAAALEAAGIEVFEVEDQTLDADPTKLEYRGLHLHTRFPDLLGVDGSAVRCEVQVRTVAEHAWAETEHRYLYKKSNDIPNEVTRIFRRLLVLVELFDQELAKGVEMIQASPSFAEYRLVRALESKFEALTGQVGDENLTRDVVHSIVEAGGWDMDGLIELVDAYAVQSAEVVSRIVSGYGVAAGDFDPDRDLFVTQPELLLFLALLADNPYSLSTATRDGDFSEFIGRLALWTDATGYQA